MTDSDPLPRLPYVRDALAELRAASAVRRLYERDASLWSGDPEEEQAIGSRLGWLDVAGGRDEWRTQLHELTDDLHRADTDHVVLAGMGGSSLAPELFARLFAPGEGLPLVVLDSTHPARVRALLDDTGLSDAVVVVSSKSGGTEETRSFAAHAKHLLGDPRWLIAITDPESPLAEQARTEGWRLVLANPPDIGGRYSALSLFGMAPAALAGVDYDAIWDRGRAMAERCASDAHLEKNPAAVLAAFMGGLARAGRDKLTILCEPVLEPLADWIEQLVAESTGKEGVGIIPVVGEPAGPAEVYGTDRAFVVFRLADEEPEPGAAALSQAGHPVLSIDLVDRLDVGGEFVRWEVATALAGVLLGINPFDEPNVTESKRNTAALLHEVAVGGTLPPPEADAGGRSVNSLISSMSAGDYLAIQAYLQPTSTHAAALARLRTAARAQTRCATTAGWGPRFLHSTGQLHKGGPNTMVGVQLVDASLWEPGAGAPAIPDRSYDFGTLLRAQAVGDLRSLRAHGRRVVQIGIRSPADIDHITASLSRE